MCININRKVTLFWYKNKTTPDLKRGFFTFASEPLLKMCVNNATLIAKIMDFKN